jgi:hypothetical protein
MAKKVEVWQGGVVPDLSGGITFKEVKVHDFTASANHPISSQRGKRGLAMAVKHPSKGGGETRVWTFVPPGMFQEIAETMMRADPAAAEMAFLAVLTQGAKSRAKRP